MGAYKIIQFSFLSSSHVLNSIYHSIFNSLAFIETIIVLNDINTAPKAGLITIPCLYKIPAAKGNAIMLYAVAQTKF
jgi:hypothetical protein